MNLFSISTLILCLSGIVFSLIIYRTDRGNKINRAWFYSCISFSLWALGLSGVTLSKTEGGAMMWQYLLDVSAIFLPYLYFNFVIKLLGRNDIKLRLFLLIVAISFSIFSFSPGFKIGMLSKYGFLWIDPGNYYFLFLVYFVAYSILTLSFLIFGYVKAEKGSVLRSQIRNTIFGCIMGYGGGVTNFFPQLFSIYPYGNYLVIFYIVFMVYGVLKYKLLSAKVISAQIFSTALVLIALFDILRSVETTDWLFNFFTFILMSVFSIFLINSVNKEVSQRERIEKLAGELKAANDGQRSFLHFLSHEVKGNFALVSALFDTILTDKDYGPISEKLRDIVVKGMRRNRGAVADIEDILMAADLKNGAMKYDMKTFDLRNSLSEIIKDAKIRAEEKGLKFQFAVDETKKYEVQGDERQLVNHAIKNVIENSIIYTLKGEIMINLSRKDGKIVLAIADSGVGISPEDKARLFTEGGKGIESSKVNAHSTGHGLFIAKQIITAHGGRVWAESEGRGKGSIFFVELG